VSRGLHRSPDAPTEANALIQGVPAGEEQNSEMRPTTWPFAITIVRSRLQE
jgi:hypothetical protein